ncbi:hypothetical protein BZL42_24785 [Pseudomonas indica]|nr:hypothetical protein BZL42_24785 [Pseudomonas indica]
MGWSLSCCEPYISPPSKRRERCYGAHRHGHSHGQTCQQKLHLNDGDGLSLFVGANGAKHWYFRFSWHGGKQSRISFGTYPDVSLKQARQLRDEARALVAQGIDPRQHKQQSRRVVSLAAENTFRSLG